ncbi:MAG TPA: coenzyme F420-0:L-glutamate ligase [Dehalococcoidia bacterium]|nr:coenzyme F420-0:L-glutamate ligase [Dehalococcoidia bacterium]
MSNDGTATKLTDFRVIGITGIPLVEEGDDIAHQMIDAAAEQGTPLEDGDVLAVTQRIASKAEGQIVPLNSYDPSPFALDYAQRMEKDPRLVEAVLQESIRVVRQVGGILITQTRHGFICANAGIDGSNVGPGEIICLLPVDPDASCERIRVTVREQLGIEVAVLMTDTFGRPWREGHTNIAIGVAGFEPMRSYVGMPDMDGRELHVTTICVADELAATSELVMGKLDAIPVAIIRGFDYTPGEGSSEELVRVRENDLFL